MSVEVKDKDNMEDDYANDAFEDDINTNKKSHNFNESIPHSHSQSKVALISPAIDKEKKAFELMKKKQEMELRNLLSNELKNEFMRKENTKKDHEKKEKEEKRKSELMSLNKIEEQKRKQKEEEKENQKKLEDKMRKQADKTRFLEVNIIH